MFKKYKKLTVFIIILFFIIFVFSRGHIYDESELEYGVTFSKKQAEDLGLDWREAYLAILDDLKVKKLRLPAYWNEVELANNNYFWDDLDWQVEEAARQEVQIIMSVGGRLPRWPECHFPDWAEKTGESERKKELLDIISLTIERYKDNKAIVAWQVENEPFLSHFGNCPKLDKDFLDKEILLVRNMDSRPIVITDSGELSFWVPAAKRADIFGTTMYRDTYSSFLKRYVHYPIRPGFFRFKKNLAGLFAKPDEWIVIELQAEPWGPEPFQNLSPEERGRTMDLEKFKEMIEFSAKTGFKELYLWGAEWWYWEKVVNGNEGLWEEARKLF